MKKSFLLVLLVLITVCLSACSPALNKNVVNTQDVKRDEAYSPSLNTAVVSTVGEKQEGVQNQAASDNFVYKNNDYRFQITFPNIWGESIVKSEKGAISFQENIEFPSNEIIFGFPIKFKMDGGNQSAVEKCDSCFLEIFRLSVLSREESRNFEIAREADILKNGANPFNSSYIVLASNNEYVFYGPESFFGQSYDGEFISSRESEARGAVFNQFMTWNYLKFTN